MVPVDLFTCQIPLALGSPGPGDDSEGSVEKEGSLLQHPYMKHLSLGSSSQSSIVSSLMMEMFLREKRT
jgi:hypothetical protein